MAILNVYSVAIKCKVIGLDGSVGYVPTGDQKFASLIPRVRQHSFVEIDHGIFLVVIHSLPLIQKGQLSVLAKECAQILVKFLED